MLKQLLFLEPLPGGSRWAAAFGSLLLFTFVLQVVTGILLTMNYAPSAETAWPSVNFIQEEVPFGKFIRAMHHWGSSAMVILLLVHLVQVYVWGAYKKPRELTWMVGVLLLFCTLGLSFTGYLLPWDQKSYWATKVGLSIASTTPVVGDDLKTLLQGGSQLGNLTLTRFFTIHTFLLPGMVIFLVVIHLYLFRIHGVTPPWWESEAQLKAEEEPFWPKQVLKDGVLALSFLLGLGLWAYFRPAPLEAQADPSQPYEARPEWYFMFLFQLLRYFHGPFEIVGTFVLPTVFCLVLLIWPFLDRSPHRDPRRRPVAMGLLAVSTASLIGLTIFAIATDVRMQEPTQAAARKPDPPGEPAGPLQRADVALLYTTNCANCHGVDGSGNQIRAGMPTIPDFTRMAWQIEQTDLEITHFIRDGKEPLMPAYRDKLAQQKILALTIFVRAFAVALPDAAGQKPIQPPPPSSFQSSPAQLYRTYCLACHDADGSGETIRKIMPDVPNFKDLKWQTARTNADFKHAILEGKGKFMLPMKSKLSLSEADQLGDFVRAFREGKQVVNVEPPQPVVLPPQTKPAVGPPSKPTPGDSAETAGRLRSAAGLYRQYCLICHGGDGKGLEFKASAPSIPDFTAHSWQNGVSDAQLSVGILEGKGTLMPAFRGRVTDEQTRVLSAYIRAFGPARAAPSDTNASDFDKNFNELRDQWNELQRQLDKLSKPPPKP